MALSRNKNATQKLHHFLTAYFETKHYIEIQEWIYKLHLQSCFFLRHCSLRVVLACQLKPATAAGKKCMDFQKSLAYTHKLTASIVFSHSTRAAKSFREINTKKFFKAEKRALKIHTKLYKQRLNQIKQDLHLKAFL